MRARKVGRPPVYGFDALVVGESWSADGDSLKLERMRAAALAHARQADKVFRTEKADGKITITRVE